MNPSDPAAPLHSPQPSKAKSRRPNQRVQRNSEVVLCCLDRQGRQQRFRARAVDVSKTGILVQTEEPVKEGTIVGTVVQQPYEWGYQGMKDMAKYLEGDKSFVPANGLIIVPTKIIDKSNVDAFWAELKERQGKK